MAEWFTDNSPVRTIKHTTIYFFDQDAGRAKELAAAEIKAKRNAFTRDATSFLAELEPCHDVVILPSVRAHHRAVIKNTYKDYAKIIELEEPKPWQSPNLAPVPDSVPSAKSTSVEPSQPTLAAKSTGRRGSSNSQRVAAAKASRQS